MKELEAQLQPIFDMLGGLLWGWPMLILLITTGVLYTVMLKGIQFSKLGKGLWMAFHPHHNKKSEGHDGDISHFQALMTALSATVGTGNIAGVATAIAAGGPGAIFWMWITGILGMATKYAEAVLGVHYREKNENGEMSGGPMYYIQNGLKMRWLAILFSLFLALGALGIGNMVQSNSVADVMYSTFAVPAWMTGAILTVLTALVLLGGIKRIGKVASGLVPTMIFVYLCAGTLVLLNNLEQIPAIFEMIFTDAFTGTAATGGFLGAAVKEVMRYGFSRGVFSNESGMGSSPIAAAAAKTKHPVEQALVSMTQTFIDTMVVCTFTGLIILCSGLWTAGIDGPTLTARAFDVGLNNMDVLGHAFGSIIVSVCLVFFAFSTLLGWSYYGVKGVTFIFGQAASAPYKVLFIACVLLGSLIQLKLAWNVAEVLTGLMIIPNLIALILLSPKVRKLTIDYFRNEKDDEGYQVDPFYEK